MPPHQRRAGGAEEQRLEVLVVRIRTAVRTASPAPTCATCDQPDATADPPTCRPGQLSLLRPGMRLAVHLDQVRGVDVRVALRRAELRVAEQFLDAAHVGAALQQVRRKRVAQRVRRDAEPRAAERDVLAHQPVHAARREPLSAVVDEQRMLRAPRCRPAGRALGRRDPARGPSSRGPRGTRESRRRRSASSARAAPCGPCRARAPCASSGSGRRGRDRSARSGAGPRRRTARASPGRGGRAACRGRASRAAWPSPRWTGGPGSSARATACRQAPPGRPRSAPSRRSQRAKVRTAASLRAAVARLAPSRNMAPRYRRTLSGEKSAGGQRRARALLRRGADGQELLEVALVGAGGVIGDVAVVAAGTR